MITKERVLENLRKKGIVIEKIAADIRVYENACEIAYKAMPIPLRWFVGKKRIREIVSTIKGRVLQ